MDKEQEQDARLTKLEERVSILENIEKGNWVTVASGESFPTVHGAHCVAFNFNDKCLYYSETVNGSFSKMNCP